MPSTKINESPTLAASPSALKAYFLASRPKTWIASLSPVCIGTFFSPKVNVSIFCLTLLFSLLIQVGTNFANDYFDYIKGADTHLRNGPKRATQEGWIQPKAMKAATFLAFSLSFLVALPLMKIAGLWSLFLALTCIALGILYTGGPKPIGYQGLGEVFVLIFFGPIATCGSYYLQTKMLSTPVLIASFAPGFLSCAILCVNNLRDEKTDRIAKKNTLIVRFGRKFGAWEYTLSLILAGLTGPLLTFYYPLPSFFLLTALLPLLSLHLIHKVFYFKDPLELLSVLPKTGRIFFLLTFIYLIALW